MLGSVLLAITGAEALYADMGHFGKSAIRIAWFGLVAPSLVLNYFGQGALLISDPKALENPFFLAFPRWALYPMVGLATAATVIASQATISGAYSMTQQAIQLGYLPRMAVRHTSSKTIGQIYVPTVNAILLVAVTLAVIGFGSSTRLASAYGVAVMGTMMTTTFLTFFVIRYGWKYPLWLCLLATGFFMLVDATFFAATMHKVFDGGWFPLLLGATVFSLMVIWRRGRIKLLQVLQSSSIPLGPFLESLFLAPPQRVPGTAVFLTSTPDATPHALLHSLKHYKALHERNVFLTVEFHDVPWVSFEDRVSCEKLGHCCWRVMVRYGFMNRARCRRRTGAVRPRRPADRTAGGVLFHVAREDRAVRAREKRAGALARPHLCGDGPQRGQRHGLFQDPDQPGGGTRNAHGDLKRPHRIPKKPGADITTDR